MTATLGTGPYPAGASDPRTAARAVLDQDAASKKFRPAPPKAKRHASLAQGIQDSAVVLPGATRETLDPPPRDSRLVVERAHRGSSDGRYRVVGPGLVHRADGGLFEIIAVFHQNA